MAVQISGNDITVPRDTTVTRNLTVGGVLTYEDVTNVDSVGLVTARSGIEIGARPGVAASISVDGNMIISGISTFGGDIQVPDKIIHSGDTNTAIRFPAADTVTVETGGSERARIDSSGRMGLGTNSPLAPLHTYDATNNTIARLESGDATCRLQLKDNTGEAFVTATGDNLIFANTSSVTERLRITSAGQMVMGATTSKAKFEIKDNGYTSSTVLQRISTDDANPYALIIANDTCNTSAASGMQLFLGNDGLHYIRARGSSTAGNNNLLIQAQNDIRFGSGSSETERVRITSGGQLNIGSNLTQTNSTLFVQGGSGDDGIINLLELKHANTSTSTGGGTGDGPALLLNGYYSGAEWQFAKICSVNSGSGFGADFQLHVHPQNNNQGASLVKALSVLGDGTGANVTITDGNLKIGTSGHGIDFSATADGGTTTPSELLDDYEEGTWAPAITASSGNSATTNIYHASYTKVGNKVFITCYIGAGSNSSTGGYWTVTGLPYTSKGSNHYFSISVGYWNSLQGNINFLTGTVQPGDTSVLMRGTSGSTTATSNLSYAGYVANGTEFLFSATYLTA